MKIVFNTHDVGLGNNGGSRTIIRSAETLSLLGHDVFISGTVNKATWFETNVPFIKKIPKCDAIIATGYHSLRTTRKFRGAETKLWYVRGHEIWQATNDQLWESYSSINVVTNSTWIHEDLKKRSIESKVIYQGIDFENWYSSRKPDLVVGGLFHKKDSKRTNDCIDIAKKSGYADRLLNRDFSSGKTRYLRDFYSSCAVWVSSSENEGLQNVPIEATLCGAALVLTDHPQSGNSDYGINNETCIIYPARDTRYAAHEVERLMHDESLRSKLQSNAERVIKEKIGDRKRNMSLFVNHIEKLLSEGK